MRRLSISEFNDLSKIDQNKNIKDLKEMVEKLGIESKNLNFDKCDIHFMAHSLNNDKHMEKKYKYNSEYNLNENTIVDRIINGIVYSEDHNRDWHYTYNNNVFAPQRIRSMPGDLNWSISDELQNLLQTFTKEDGEQEIFAVLGASYTHKDKGELTIKLSYTKISFDHPFVVSCKNVYASVIIFTLRKLEIIN